MTSQTYGGSTTTGTGESQGVADNAKSAAQGVAGTTKSAAADVAGTAKQEAGHVASVAAEQGKAVAGEAAAHGRQLVSELRSQIDSQARSQQESIRSLITDFTSELRSMADSGNGGVASTVARQVADRAEGLTGYLEGRGPTDLVEDLRHFARRRPGTFLLGAALTGLVAGRFVRSVRDEAGSSQPRALTAGPSAGSYGGGTAYGDSTFGGTSGIGTSAGMTDVSTARPSSSGVAATSPLAGGSLAPAEEAWTSPQGSASGISSSEGTGGSAPHGSESIQLPGETADVGSGAHRDPLGDGPSGSGGYRV